MIKDIFDPRQFVKCVGDAIMAVDRNGDIIFWNQAAERLLGYAADDVLGQSMEVIIPEESRSAHWVGFDRAIETGKTRLGKNLSRVPALHKDGRCIRIAVAVGVLRDAQDQIEAMGAIIREDESRKSAES